MCRYHLLLFLLYNVWYLHLPSKAWWYQSSPLLKALVLCIGSCHRYRTCPFKRNRSNYSCEDSTAFKEKVLKIVKYASLITSSFTYFISVFQICTILQLYTWKWMAGDPKILICRKVHRKIIVKHENVRFHFMYLNGICRKRLIMPIK